MTLSKVSIIIPNYNHAAFLQQRLDSVFNQTYQDFEVILLDDASTDESANLLKTYENHPKVNCVVINTENSGSPFKQWQKGIDLAKGDYIWIAESDDYCELNLLETCLESLNTEVGVSYVQSVDVNTEGEMMAHRVTYTDNFKPNIWNDGFTMDGSQFVSQYLTVKNVIPNASAVVFRKELLNYDSFKEQLLAMKMCGDWLFWMQLVSKTNITFINEDLNFFRHHDQVSRNHENIDKKKRRLLEEKVIRNHVFEQLGLFKKNAEKSMYNKWFGLHAIKDVFNNSFFEIKLSRSNYFIFINDYFNYKLKNKKY